MKREDAIRLMLDGKRLNLYDGGGVAYYDGSRDNSPFRFKKKDIDEALIMSISQMDNAVVVQNKYQILYRECDSEYFNTTEVFYENEDHFLSSVGLSKSVYSHIAIIPESKREM